MLQYERVLESVILIEVLGLQRPFQVVHLNGQLPRTELLGLGHLEMVEITGGRGVRWITRQAFILHKPLL